MLRDIIRLTIDCAVCGENTEQTIAWLVNHDTLTCRHCLGAIDLNVEKTRAIIKHFDDASAAFGEPTDETS